MRILVCPTKLVRVTRLISPVVVLDHKSHKECSELRRTSIFSFSVGPKGHGGKAPAFAQSTSQCFPPASRIKFLMWRSCGKAQVYAKCQILATGYGPSRPACRYKNGTSIGIEDSARGPIDDFVMDFLNMTTAQDFLISLKAIWLKNMFTT